MSIVSHLHHFFNAETCQSYIHTTGCEFCISSWSRTSGLRIMFRDCSQAV